MRLNLKMEKIIMAVSLSNADKDILGRALKEFEGSMTRCEAERDLQKGICDRVKDTTGIMPKQTRLLAKLYFKQNKVETEAEFDEVLGLYEQVYGGESND